MAEESLHKAGLNTPTARPDGAAVPRPMTAFVNSVLATLAESAHQVERGQASGPKARRLMLALRDRKNILVTTHEHPDPDALASSLGLRQLLQAQLPAAKVSMSIKGQVGGGLNTAFAQQSDLQLEPWDEQALGTYDAIVLLDVQPGYKFCPLPATIVPTAVIDHHRNRGPRPVFPFVDIRPDVGATSSIVFSYFMELRTSIPPDLAATLLFAIETDLAGSAGQPGELDNLALSSLTLLADTRKLYKMRYVDLPQSYYIAYADGLANAMYYDNALTSFIETVESPEKPAVIADFLLRFDQVQTVLVTAVYENSLIMSLRTSSPRVSAADLIRRLTRKLGEGGGHQTKAGGMVPLANGSPTEIERTRNILRRRFLRALKIHISRGQRLVQPRPTSHPGTPSPHSLSCAPKNASNPA